MLLMLRDINALELSLKPQGLTLLSQGPSDHVLPDVILLRQVEELADLAGPFGSKTTGHSAVCQSRDVVLT